MKRALAPEGWLQRNSDTAPVQFLFRSPERRKKRHSSRHPGQSLCAAAYGLLNAMLLIAAAIGFVRRKVPLPAMLLAYVALRCVVLLGMPNAEPRYTLEAFPIVIVAAAVAFLSSQRSWMQDSHGLS